MIKKGIISLLAIIGIISVSVLVTYFFVKKNEIKLVYIDVNKVYNEFKLTKELDAKITTTQTIRKNIMDSLSMELESISRELSIKGNNKELQNVFMLKRQDYISKEKKFLEDNEAQVSMYNEQIFKQMNQYIDEYKKENNLDFILGASGNGYIMAATERLDITKLIIEYINEKYKGIK
ncbi:MAG: OmpH family outer membrane protein [Bacteroidia bacterium]